MINTFTFLWLVDLKLFKIPESAKLGANGFEGESWEYSLDGMVSFLLDTKVNGRTDPSFTRAKRTN